jgi:bacterioferritin (cytochrome b1)
VLSRNQPNLHECISKRRRIGKRDTMHAKGGRDLHIRSMIVDKLKAMIPDLENEQKKHSLREFVKHLRDEADEHRKYLALVKQK